MPRIGVITGSRREAACLGSLSNTDTVDVACSGADAMIARRQAEQLLAGGCDALLSFGLAGGLDPDLPSGTLILATSVISPNGRQSDVDGDWRAMVASGLDVSGIDYVSGPVVGVEQPVGDPEPKRLLHTGTGGLGVDMESHAVMEVAGAKGVPWLVLRAVADTANDALPDLAMESIAPDGSVRAGALAVRLIRHPSDMGELFALWRVSRPGFAALGRVAALPGLCRPL